MRFNDAVIGACLVIFAIAEITYTRTFPSLMGQAYGPDLFPRIIGMALIACGLVLIFRGITHRARCADERSDGYAWFTPGDWANERSTRLNVALIPICVLAYILFADWLGFILLSLGILFVLMIRLGTSIPVALACAVLCTVVIHLVFASLLLVPLPAGLLLPLLT